MKRHDFIRHLERHGCAFLREGGNHTIYVRRAARTVSAVPRHKEINEFLVRKICRDLQVPAVIIFSVRPSTATLPASRTVISMRACSSSFELLEGDWRGSGNKLNSAGNRKE